MTPVRLATRRISTAPLRAHAGVAGVRLGRATWMQFGDEIVYLGTERQWPGVVESAHRASVELNEREGLVDEARLHVLIQKGRLFQREFPNVPVLIDKGRFLLVDLDQDLASELQKRKEPCFSVRRLDLLDAAGASGRSRIVFEARGRRSRRTATRAAEPAIQALVDRVSRETFEADLAELVALPTRHSTSTHYRTACDLVEQKLSALGYTISRQTVGVNGSESQNLVAQRDGTGAGPRGAVLVTAHLDSVNHEGNASSPAPGADDDGSGSAGVVEIARALRDKTSAHDLVFVLFGGEEQGLLGSEHFVTALSPAQRSRVRAVVNMDMIGTLNTATPTVLLEGRAISQPMLDDLAVAASTYTALSVETSLNAANSDHVSFLDQGIPAVLTIEGADSTNDEVHTSRDTIDRINFDLALDILRMNTAFVATALARS